MAYFYSAHNFETGEHFGFDVISSKVSQIGLQSLRKSDTVLTQYADREIPPIYIYDIYDIYVSIYDYQLLLRSFIRGVTDLNNAFPEL